MWEAIGYLDSNQPGADLLNQPPQKSNKHSQCIAQCFEGVKGHHGQRKVWMAQIKRPTLLNSIGLQLVKVAGVETKDGGRWTEVRQHVPIRGPQLRHSLAKLPIACTSSPKIEAFTLTSERQLQQRALPFSRGRKRQRRGQSAEMVESPEKDQCPSQLELNSEAFPLPMISITVYLINNKINRWERLCLRPKKLW